MTPADAWTIVAAAATSIGITAAGMFAAAKWFGERLAERWLKGVEAKHATELAHVEHELDRLNLKAQAHLDHAVTVSRAQFEVEFGALRDIWKCVSEVRATVVGIVPHAAPEHETRAERITRFEKARAGYIEALNQLVSAVDHNSPFYPEALYTAVDEFRGRGWLERSQLETMKPPFYFEPPEDKFDWYGRRQKAVDELLALADLVSAAIRSRLASIAIRE